MATIKEKMQRARQLIKQKKYDEARAILRTVKHPTAKDWLTKIDKIAPASTPQKSKAKKKPGMFRRALRTSGIILVFLCGLTILAAMFSGGESASVPTAVVQAESTATETATPDEPVDVNATAFAEATLENLNALVSETALSMIETANAPTVTPIQTNTPFPTFTPRPTNTLIPTIPPRPTNTVAVFVPTQIPETENLHEWLSQQDGVDVVLAVSVRGTDSLLFYAEVIVYPPHNTLNFAESFKSASEQLAGGRTIDQVSIIISDGVNANDYVWMPFRDDWQITPLSDYIPTPRPSDSNATSSQRDNGRTMYASDGSVRIRSCPDANNPACTQVNVLSRGDRIIVYETVQGSAYGDSTLWYRAEHNGREGYVHSELVQSNPPSNPTAVPIQPVTSSSSNQSTTTNQSAATWNCSGDRYNCPDFNTCEEVMSYWNACPGDPSGLDGPVGPGSSGVPNLPCESICGG